MDEVEDGVEHGVGEVRPRRRARRVVDEAKRRLWRLGPEVLSDDELLALVTGLSSAESIATLLEGGLRALSQTPAEALLQVPRISPRGVSRLLAATELGRRLARPSDEPRPRLGTPQAIWEWARSELVDGKKESFHVLCLNPRNVLVRHAQVAMGSVDQCHVDPREALAPAVVCRASALVLLHNHPSGDPEPSVQDVALTRQLREGARLLCIRLVDHLVLSATGYVSMLARGLLGEERAVVPRVQTGEAGLNGLPRRGT